MEKKIIELTKVQYYHLKNVVIWADLYDKVHSGGKNARIFDAIREGWDYVGGGSN